MCVWVPCVWAVSMLRSIGVATEQAEEMDAGGRLDCDSPFGVGLSCTGVPCIELSSPSPPVASNDVVAERERERREEVEPA